MSGYRGRGRGGRGGRGGRSAPTAPSTIGSLLEVHLCFDAAADETAFADAEEAHACPVALSPAGAPPRRAVLPEWTAASAEALLQWFAAVSGEAVKATLRFPASLTKEERAQLHTLAEALRLSGRSDGVGSDRALCVLSRAAAAAAGPCHSPSQPEVAKLMGWARDAGVSVSWNEAAALLAQPASSWPPALAERAARAGAAASAVAAAKRGDLAALSATPRALLRCVDDASGETALHAAARFGHDQCVSWLLSDGNVPHSVRDNRGGTALDAALRAGQDYPAYLLRAAAAAAGEGRGGCGDSSGARERRQDAALIRRPQRADAAAGGEGAMGAASWSFVGNGFMLGICFGLASGVCVGYTLARGFRR